MPLSHLFFSAAEEMLVPCQETTLHSAFKHAIISSLDEGTVEALASKWFVDKRESLYQSLNVSVDSMRQIILQLLALHLVEPQTIMKKSSTDPGADTLQRCWSLTHTGRAKYLEYAAVLAGDG